MKNHKGTVATLLTLGLVLIGSLVIFGISYLTNNNKIASNPRAAEDSCSLPDDRCYIVKCINGKPGKLLYSSSLCQYDMPASSCSGGSPYSGGGEMIIGEAAAIAKVNSGFTCTGSGGTGSGNDEQGGGDNFGGTGSTGPATDACPTIDYNCNKIDAKIYKDHVLSKDEDGLYHDGDSCKGKGVKKDIIKTDVCDGYRLTTNECFSWNCQSINTDWESIKLLAMGDEDRTYYTDLEGDCNTKSYDATTIVSICNPGAAPTCDSVSCSVATGKNDVDFGDKEVFQWSNKVGTYYKADDCEDKVSSNLKTECPLPDEPLGLNNPIGITITSNQTDYSYCYMKTKSSTFEANPVSFITACKDFYGDSGQIHKRDKWDYYYCCQS